MPKDYINFRLTGERAIDFTEATCSYLLDIRPVPGAQGGY
jgi:xylulokinase